MITSRALEWTLLIISLLPFFLLSVFNQPTDDDFHDASRGLNEDFITYQKVLYTAWTGRYTGNLLYALGYRIPTLDSWLLLIKLAPVFWLLSLISAGYFALKAILPSIKHKVAIRFALWGVLLLMFGMPLLASAIYWFCGAAIYTFGSILTLVLVGTAGQALHFLGAYKHFTS